MKSCLLGAVSASLLSLSTVSTSHATVIDAYFGMNFVAAGFSGGPVLGLEVNLLEIKYLGDGGLLYTTTMPAFPGTDPVLGTPRTGLPDGIGLSALPTYTTVTGGDGETTRTIGATVPINWDASGAFPKIDIYSIKVDAPGVGGIWTADFLTPYTVGLIQQTGDTELASNSVAPQGDIYDGLVGVAGNPIGSAIATSAPAGYEDFLNGAFGTFVFAAAPVPLPSAIWLFGSGLLGMVGIARRKKAA